MNRKWIALGATLTAALLVAGGFSVAAHEDSPLHGVMEKVQASNAVVLKGVRNAAAYKKSQADVVKAADALVKLAKESATLGEGPSKAQNKDVAEWKKLNDAWLTESEKFAKLVASPATDQAAAKAAYREVSKSCTTCHNVFRVDE
jgi:cytochrome c556